MIVAIFTKLKDVYPAVQSSSDMFIYRSIQIDFSESPHTKFDEARSSRIFGLIIE